MPYNLFLHLGDSVLKFCQFPCFQLGLQPTPDICSQDNIPDLFVVQSLSTSLVLHLSTLVLCYVHNAVQYIRSSIGNQQGKRIQYTPFYLHKLSLFTCGYNFLPVADTLGPIFIASLFHDQAQVKLVRTSFNFCFNFRAVNFFC